VKLGTVAETAATRRLFPLFQPPFGSD
jgi:hypothetical protein